AAFAHVDVAAGELQRRVESHVWRLLDRLVDGEKRGDLDNAADAGSGDDQQHEADRGSLDLAVEQFAHDYSAGLGAAPVAAFRSGRSACCLADSGAALTVIQTL